MNNSTMTGATQQIVTAYEECGLSAEKIVEAFEGEFELAAVRATLIQFSAKYRQESGAKTNPDKVPQFSQEDEEVALKGIRALAEYAEDEGIRAKCLMYMREDRRGRRDAVSKLANSGGTNIIQFQMFLNKANEALKLTEQKSIEIKSEKVA